MEKVKEEVKEGKTAWTLAEIPFREGTIKQLKSINSILNENIKNIEIDFIKMYNTSLSTENLTKDQVGQIKSDLFIAFCYGLLTGSDTTSAFRRSFNLPDDMNPAKKIIDPNDRSKLPNSGIIL